MATGAIPPFAPRHFAQIAAIPAAFPPAHEFSRILD